MIRKKMIKEIVSQKMALLIEPFELTQEQKDFNKKSLRWLACFAIVLGFAVVFVGRYIYKLDYTFTSISASANFYGTAYILPFVLGGMAIFFWSYIGYAKIDSILTKTMSITAFFVAMFQCDEFVSSSTQKISLLGLSPSVSNIIHSVAAVALFLSLILWIICFFTLTKDEETGRSIWKWKGLSKEKKIRNRVYFFMGIIELVGLVFVVMNFCKVTGVPFVWLGEVIILISAGIALLVKSGLQLFADK